MKRILSLINSNPQNHRLGLKDTDVVVMYSRYTDDYPGFYLTTAASITSKCYFCNIIKYTKIDLNHRFGDKPVEITVHNQKSLHECLDLINIMVGFSHDIIINNHLYKEKLDILPDDVENISLVDVEDGTIVEVKAKEESYLFKGSFKLKLIKRPKVKSIEDIAFSAIFYQK